MKYGILPRGMWALYKRSFQKALATTVKEPDPAGVMQKAHKEYRAILEDVDEFDRDDKFIVNILSCSMLVAVLRNMSKPCDVETARIYYEAAMDNALSRYIVTHTKTYTAKGQAAMKQRAERSQQIQHPYSWKFTYEAGEDVNEYTAIFSACGICHLMKQLGMEQYIPAMCAYDYPMNAMANTEFTRQYTLAGGGPYCDCHYRHKRTTNHPRA